MTFRQEMHAAKMRLQSAGRRLLQISRQRDRTAALREYWSQVRSDRQLAKGRVLETLPSAEQQSTRDAIARCLTEQKAALPHIQTEGGKMWVEDWVKEEILIRLESGCCITEFEPLPPADVAEQRG